MRVRLGWIYAVLLGTGVVGAAYLASKPTTGNGDSVLSNVAAPTSPPLQSPPVSTSAASKPTTIDSKPQSAPVQGRKLAAEFGSATDFRRFALSAAQHPEIGGISYALYASSICRALENILPVYGLGKTDTIPYRANEDTSAYAARVKSLELARRNCASFSSSELSGTEEIRQTDLARTQGDIIFAMKDRLNKARKSSDASAKSSAIAEILSSKDPLLLSDTLQRMMMDRNDAGQLGYWLDGQFTLNADSDALAAAIKAIPCRYGLPCDANDAEVMQACLGGNGCYESRDALLRASIPAEAQGKYEALQQRLKAIIDSGDVTAITRRK